LARAVETGGS